ncbi:MAG: hypothetical protein KJ904_17240 [Alphaproteobacteria bacterium]|nr:hypothetical protein [Alphaproteobacteria bacterium]MBU0797309.1 hypothetical protein [Alphaproteobacteria bacterium]MBU0888903.1 hypothetical protein [Alphaproteobacteria bacterium]MBU1813923.1 hypothetical protein [Alphaproteobacteria bacterium]
MKTKFAFIPFALAAALVVSAPSLSQAATIGDAKEPGGPRAEKMMEHLDANKDGKISREEFEAGRPGGKDDKFADFDKNADGALSKEEYQAMFMARTQKMAERTFDRLDANKDGKIDAGERQAHQDAMFKRLDKNGDGSITADELRASPPKR